MTVHPEKQLWDSHSAMSVQCPDKQTSSITKPKKKHSRQQTTDAKFK